MSQSRKGASENGALDIDQHDRSLLPGVRGRIDEGRASPHQVEQLQPRRPADLDEVLPIPVVSHPLYEVHSVHGYLLGRLIDRLAAEAAMERWQQAAYPSPKKPRGSFCRPIDQLVYPPLARPPSAGPPNCHRDKSLGEPVLPPRSSSICHSPPAKSRFSAQFSQKISPTPCPLSPCDDSPQPESCQSVHISRTYSVQ